MRIVPVSVKNIEVEEKWLSDDDVASDTKEQVAKPAVMVPTLHLSALPPSTLPPSILTQRLSDRETECEQLRNDIKRLGVEFQQTKDLIRIQKVHQSRELQAIKKDIEQLQKTHPMMVMNKSPVEQLPKSWLHTICNSSFAGFTVGVGLVYLAVNFTIQQYILLQAHPPT